jgi:hypothetical protein
MTNLSKRKSMISLTGNTINMARKSKNNRQNCTKKNQFPIRYPYRILLNTQNMIIKVMVPMDIL